MKKSATASFLLELPLRVDAHLEAARQPYNALLGQPMKRLRQMRADPGWQQARLLPRTHIQERSSAFAALRAQYGFSEYGLHAAAKDLRCSCWPRMTSLAPTDADGLFLTLMHKGCRVNQSQRPQR